MIIDLGRFIAEERPYWRELEGLLDQLEKEPVLRLDLARIQRFHYLYQRTSAGLAKITGCSADQKIRLFLENLVARAYGNIHETRQKRVAIDCRGWFFNTFPITFRRHVKAFFISLAVMAMGGVFGGLALTLDPLAKEILIPFSHLEDSPAQRVAREEQRALERKAEPKSAFSAFLMTHNTRVSIFVLALGFTFGLGTMILLFYNGVILGAVAADYILADKTTFLLGWLLPHGSIEIPSILIAGQAGLIIAGAMLGRQSSLPLILRLRRLADDLVTLITGVALLLIWAGLIEAFFSQYHEPVIPYGLKIAFGLLELFLLTLFLFRSGKKTERVLPHVDVDT